MKVYLVGGAVRDHCLGLPVKDRDWVVVGATPEMMLSRGYRPVGRDFPVFLHPQTQEEYALARQERKQGHGYRGFVTQHGPDISLADDLSRRDLTINAMAQDEEGQIIDPYGGLDDLAQRRLRHVSPAFAEDPLRVLRVARFAARYQALGFTVAAETQALMRAMASSGELSHLVPERVWQETQRALMESQPARYFECLREVDALPILFPELAALVGVPQESAHHPGLDAWQHTCMALNVAAQEAARTEIRFAVLTHDLGKALTPKSEWPQHKEHEQRGLEPLAQLCQRLRCPKAYQDLARITCRWHIQVHQALQLSPQAILELFEQCDAFRQTQRFHHLLMACQCDARGRIGQEQCDYPAYDYLSAALTQVQKVNAAPLIQQGYTGAALGHALRDDRLARLYQWMQQQHN